VASPITPHYVVELAVGLSIVDYSHPDETGKRVTAGKLNTAMAAKRLGVSKPTLLRWFKQRKIADVGRDRHGWRVFTPADINRISKEMGLNT
jgi:hypothetical protein